MNSSNWIAIYLPLFIIFFIVLPKQQSIKKFIILKIKKRKGFINMTNELISKFIGKNCRISTGKFGTTAVGKIIDVNDNWIEFKIKKVTNL